MLAAGCGTASEVGIREATPAPPQQATLGWKEVYGKPGASLVFRVESLWVEERGWTASVQIENHSPVRFAVASGSASIDSSFGLMILPTGDHRELDRLNAAGELPAVRQAETIQPRLPGVLEPGESWRGTLSAKGALPGGSWARVVFGAFVCDGQAADGPRVPGDLAITDHTQRLRPRGQGTSVLNSSSSASAAKLAVTRRPSRCRKARARSSGAGGRERVVAAAGECLVAGQVVQDRRVLPVPLEPGGEDSYPLLVGALPVVGGGAAQHLPAQMDLEQAAELGDRLGMVVHDGGR